MEESRGMRVGKGERDGWEMAAPGGSQLRRRKAVGKRGDGGLLHPPPGQTLPIRLPASTLRCRHPHPDGRSPRPARLPVRSHAHRVTARRRRATSVSLVQFPVKNKPSLPLLAAAAELPRQRRSLCYGRAGCSPRSSRQERSASAPQDEDSTSRGLSPS